MNIVELLETTKSFTNTRLRVNPEVSTHRTQILEAFIEDNPTIMMDAYDKGAFFSRIARVLGLQEPLAGKKLPIEILDKEVEFEWPDEAFIDPDMVTHTPCQDEIRLLNNDLSVKDSIIEGLTMKVRDQDIELNRLAKDIEVHRWAARGWRDRYNTLLGETMNLREQANTQAELIQELETAANGDRLQIQTLQTRYDALLEKHHKLLMES